MKKTLLALALMGLFLPLLAKGEMGSPDTTSLSVAYLNGPTALSMLPAMEKGENALEGVSLSYEMVSNPKVLLGRLVNQELDIAVLPVNMAAILYNKGVPYQLGAVAGEGMLYLLSVADVDSWDDLKGETLYAVGKNATPDLLLQYFLKEAGLEGEVTLDFSFTQSDLTKALISGIAKYVVLPEPFASTALLASDELEVRIDLQEEWAKAFPEGPDNYPMTAVVVKTDSDPAKIEAIRQWLDLYDASLNYTVGHAEEVASLISSYPVTIDPDAARESIPRSHFIFLDANEAREEVDAYFQVLFGLFPPSIGGSIPADDFFFN